MEGGLRTRGEHKQSRSDAPLVTVITVVFNGARLLAQTLASIAAQSYRNIEHLVIDGGSTDGTLALLRKHEERIDYWVSEPDRGIYDAMNKGIALARGELIGFLNADDYYENDAVESVVDAYLAGPAQAVYYGDTYLLNDEMSLRYQSHSHIDYAFGMGICHPSMFVQRDVYKNVGGYDLQYRLAADFDFMIRALRRGVPFVAVNRFIANYRTSGLSATHLRTTLNENRRILANQAGYASREYLIYELLYRKSVALMWAQAVLGKVVGEPALQKARKWYVRIFFARQ